MDTDAAKNIEHGLIGWRRGCRCAACKGARAGYDRERHLRQRAEAEAAAFPHGTDSGWCRGCKCEACSARYEAFMAEDREWNRKFSAELRNERRREARQRARQSPLAEPPRSRR